MMRTALRQLSGHCCAGPMAVAPQSNSRNRVAISPLIADGRRGVVATPAGVNSMCSGSFAG